MKAREFDKRFDNGEDVSKYLDMTKARRLGVPRQSIIKVWVADRLEGASRSWEIDCSTFFNEL
jgi:hypothetical protein